MARHRPEVTSELRQHMAKMVRQKRIEMKLEQGELAEKLGVTPGAVGNWERLVSRPDLDMLPRLCETLQLSITELLDMKPEMCLSGAERTALESFRALTPAKQHMIQTLMDQLAWEDMRSRMQQIRSSYLKRSTYGQAASAGPGATLEDYAVPEEIYVRANPCSEKSTLIVKVNGHSMEPVYDDGTLVYVDEKQEPREGDDVVVVYENTMYIKQLSHKGLVSYNPDQKAFPVIRVNGWQDVKYVGKVIGRVNDYDIPTANELTAISEAFSPEYDPDD